MDRVASLDRLFGDNYDPEKTILISGYDLDVNNEPLKLSDKYYQVYWTVVKEPAELCIRHNELVEAKVYIPRDTIQDVVIYSPGYGGDGVCGENLYVDVLESSGRAFVFLRHNHLRIESDDPEIDRVLRSCVHCEQKRKWAKENGQIYLGPSDGSLGYDITCFREVEIPLDAIATNNDKINFHLIGHSWGGRICLISLYSLFLRREQPFYASLNSRIKTLIVLAPWWETREEVFRSYIPLIQKDISDGYFRGMAEKDFLFGLSTTSSWLLKIGRLWWRPPKQTRIAVINSIGDEHTKGWDGIFQEVAPIYAKLSSCRDTKIDFIPLPDLSPILPSQFAERNAESHDYCLSLIWEGIRDIIDGNYSSEKFLKRVYAYF